MEGSAASRRARFMSSGSWFGERKCRSLEGIMRQQNGAELRHLPAAHAELSWHLLVVLPESRSFLTVPDMDLELPR